MSARGFLGACLVKEEELLAKECSAGLRRVCVMVLRLYWAAMASYRTIQVSAIFIYKFVDFLIHT